MIHRKDYQPHMLEAYSRSAISPRRSVLWAFCRWSVLFVFAHVQVLLLEALLLLMLLLVVLLLVQDPPLRKGKLQLEGFLVPCLAAAPLVWDKVPRSQASPEEEAVQIQTLAVVLRVLGMEVEHPGDQAQVPLEVRGEEILRLVRLAWPLRILLCTRLVGLAGPL